MAKVLPAFELCLNMDFELFDHTADVGLRSFGATAEELFANAARALTSFLVDAGQIEPREVRHLEVTADDRETLLARWLKEVLYLFEVQRWVARKVRVTDYSDTQLSAELAGEPLDEPRHEILHEVKAITYHGLKIEQSNDGWLAEVIVDI